MENYNVRPEPYVGVSGFNSSVGEGTQMSAEGNAGRYGLLENRIFVEGAKAIHKPQVDGVENRYGRVWHPVGDGLRYALTDHGGSPAFADSEARIMRVAQVYMPPSRSRDREYRDRFTDLIFGRAAPWIDGVQFDQLPWHMSDEFIAYLADIRQRRGAKVILQCHAEAMEALGPQAVARKLGEYAAAGAFDYVLVDASGGKGQKLDVSRLRPYLDEAYGSAALAGVGIGVAGGLDGPIVREVMPELLADYPDLSWDAEARLRHQKPDMSLKAAMNLKREPLGNDSYLNRMLVQLYLEASSEVLGLLRK